MIVCPHDDDDDCECRKPQPGMMLEAAAATRSTSPPATSSATAGATSRPGGQRDATVFVDRGYAERLTVEPDAVFGGLGEAAEWIVGRARRTESR